MLVMALVYGACICNYTGRKEGLYRYTGYTFKISHILSLFIVHLPMHRYLVIHQEVAFHKHVRLLKLCNSGVPRPAPTTICTSHFRQWKNSPEPMGSLDPWLRSSTSSCRCFPSTIFRWWQVPSLTNPGFYPVIGRCPQPAAGLEILCAQRLRGIRSHRIVGLETQTCGVLLSQKWGALLVDHPGFCGWKDLTNPNSSLVGSLAG